MCMDSRSGPEVPSKVHGFGEAVKHWYGGRGKSEKQRFVRWGVSAILLAACTPKMDEPEGVLAVLAQGCAAGSTEALFPALDERSRFALDAIAEARTKARGAILTHYPEDTRRDALAGLGDDSEARTGAQLFARRCDDACRSRLCSKVSAVSDVSHGDSGTSVRTVRGGEYLLHRTAEGRYGVIYETDALVRERRRAFAELSSVEANVKVYQTQKALR